jgi:hypothetical protein
MWVLRQEDINRAKEVLSERRRALEIANAEELRTLQMRQAEALKAIEAELAEIAAIDRAFRTFALKYIPDGEPEVPETPLVGRKETGVLKRSQNWGTAAFARADADATGTDD